MASKTSRTYQPKQIFSLQDSFSSHLAKWAQTQALPIEDITDNLSYSLFNTLLRDKHLRDKEKLKGWYLGSRILMEHKCWDEALAFLDASMQLAHPRSMETVFHLRRNQALAAHQGHQFSKAVNYYERLIEVWTAMGHDRQDHCLPGESPTFLFNINRLKAQAWYQLGAFRQARKLLEEITMSILARDEAQTVADAPAANVVNGKWLQLKIFVPWLLTSVIRSQVRLAADPWILEPDLQASEQMLSDVIADCTVLPEGQQWLANLHTALAENMIQWCRLTRRLEVRPMLYQTAREHLAAAGKPNIAVAHTHKEQLQAMVLLLPWCELAWCEILIADTLQDAPALIAAIQTIQHQALQVSDPDFAIIAARCAWLIGTIEADCISVDATARERAARQYLIGLSLVPVDCSIDTLIERYIQADLQRLEQ